MPAFIPSRFGRPIHDAVQPPPPRAIPRALTLLLLGLATASALADTGDLLAPQALIADQSLPEATLAAQVLAARRYGSFWNTGEEALARAALAPDFVDRTLPEGRLQGIEGVFKASRAFRTAVPDLHCEITQMIVAGDRVVVHLRFTGHFTGRLPGRANDPSGDHLGKGQAIDFIATDIYRVAQGRVAENWHLEDNLRFLQQAGLVAR